MTEVATKLSSTVSTEVWELAVEKGISQYLDPVIEIARKAFLGSDLRVSVGYDAEDEKHKYIALDVEVGGWKTEELLAGQNIWSSGMGRVCPSQHAVYFVLGWQ